MHSGSFSVLGNSNTIENLRSELLREETAKELTISEPSQQGTLASPPSDRVRQIEAADALFAFAIHIPAGITAHVLYDWTKNWLKGYAADARVTEHPPSPAPSEAKQEPTT